MKVSKWLMVKISIIGKSLKILHLNPHSPESSMKVPNRSIIDENELSSQRQCKFSQDRMSEIHLNHLNARNQKPRERFTPNNLQAVKEEISSNMNSSVHHHENEYNYQNEEYGTPEQAYYIHAESEDRASNYEEVYETEVIEQEVNDSEFLVNDCKFFTFKA